MPGGSDKDSISQYYDRRAQEYEDIYMRDDLGRREEMEAISEQMRRTLLDRSVLEIACGTGFWTEKLAPYTGHIVAIDTSFEMLKIARNKPIDPRKVEFKLGDAYALDSILGDFDGGLANFWFSHVPRVWVKKFLLWFHVRLERGSRVFMADNVYVQGMGGKLSVKPGCDDTFKLRTLSDGSKHEVLKNYYTEAELERIFKPMAKDLEIRLGRCFWWVSYEVL